MTAKAAGEGWRIVGTPLSSPVTVVVSSSISGGGVGALFETKKNNHDLKFWPDMVSQ